MTPDEIAEYMCGSQCPHGKYQCKTCITAALRSAEDAMKERCAKVCEDNATIISGSIGPLMDVGWGACAKSCATAIRSLK